MIRGVLIGALGAVVLSVACAFVAVEAGLVPANADAKPSKLERWAAQTSLRATLRREVPMAPDPVALTDGNLEAGIKLYAQNCAVCHGSAEGARRISPADSIRGRRSWQDTGSKTIRKASHTGRSRTEYA